MKKTLAVFACVVSVLSVALAQAAVIQPAQTAPGASVGASSPASDSSSSAATGATAGADASSPAGSASPSEQASGSLSPVPSPARILPDMAKAESARYIVYSEIGAERAAELDARLEALFDLYGSVFHFDQASLGLKLRVREFKDKAGFDEYLNQTAGQTKDDFVYLHYASLERSELVLFPKPGDDAEASLAHQAFVQYLKAFVKNPPLWIRDGFSVYFETARWDPEGKVMDLEENLSWLETVKALQGKKALLPIGKLLSLTPDEAKSSIDVFYPQAWAFASFLVNAEDRNYNRLFWDSLSAIHRESSLADNQAAIVKLFSSWAGLDKAEAAFNDYLDGKKTFNDLVTEGVAAYGSKNFSAASPSFEAAARLDASSYIPLYYMGLIAYANGDYSLAEYDYKRALDLGCDPATANYALGVNSIAQNKTEEARTYLEAAKAAAPERYGAKADELLRKLGL